MLASVWKRPQPPAAAKPANAPRKGKLTASPRTCTSPLRTARWRQCTQLAVSDGERSVGKGTATAGNATMTRCIEMKRPGFRLCDRHVWLRFRTVPLSHEADLRCDQRPGQTLRGLLVLARLATNARSAIVCTSLHSQPTSLSHGMRDVVAFVVSCRTCGHTTERPVTNPGRKVAVM